MPAQRAAAPPWLKPPSTTWQSRRRASAEAKSCRAAAVSSIPPKTKASKLNLPVGMPIRIHAGCGGAAVSQGFLIKGPAGRRTSVSLGRSFRSDFHKPTHGATPSPAPAPWRKIIVSPVCSSAWLLPQRSRATLTRLWPPAGGASACGKTTGQLSSETTMLASSGIAG